MGVWGVAIALTPSIDLEVVKVSLRFKESGPADATDTTPLLARIERRGSV
jgi:hypothetical protein